MIEVEKIPKICLDRFNDIKNRVNDLVSKYKSLANWGKPIFNDLIEIACIYYVNNRMNVSLDKLAKWIGLDKTSLYKLVKKIKDNGKVSIYDRNTNTIIQTSVNPIDLINKIEELIQPRAKVVISDIFESSIIRNFMSRQIEKRAKPRGKSVYVSDKMKRQVITYVTKLMEYIKTNPDTWTENEVYEAILEVFKDPQQRYRVMTSLRMIPEWSRWFEGRIGSVKKVIRPKLTYITYEHYIKLKEQWKKSILSDSEFIVLWLHLTTGAREGWSVENVTPSTSIDDCRSSLIGLRWSKMFYINDTWILRVYESKTDTEWETDLSWLDPEPIDVLLRYRKTDSIISDLTGLKKVGEFMKWYRDLCKKISKLLSLPFELVPHDIRRSHLSILAELGVPLEIACSGQLGFGVGWENLDTAYVFYLRLSKHVKQRIISDIRQRQKEIALSITPS